MKHAKAGFSLLEMLCAIALAALFIGVALVLAPERTRHEIDGTAQVLEAMARRAHEEARASHSVYALAVTDKTGRDTVVLLRKDEVWRQEDALVLPEGLRVERELSAFDAPLVFEEREWPSLRFMPASGRAENASWRIMREDGVLAFTLIFRQNGRTDAVFAE